MRITDIEIKDTPPIQHIEVNDLSNVVVFGGPNGIGKTRLLYTLIEFLKNPNPTPNIHLQIEATSPEEEEIWKKTNLDTSDVNDCQLLRNVIQRPRRRNNMKSAALYFDSNRNIQQIKPFVFSFDIPDPDAEDVSWDIPFQTYSARAQDTQHAILKKVQSEQNKISIRAVKMKKNGETAMPLDFKDPLELFRGPFNSLLAPKQLDEANLREQKLYYKYRGQLLSFDTLSSGEREVVNIVFDFLLRNPRDCIVVFDEPELHLHPELVQKLIRTLTDIGQNNQFIFGTHSPSIISSSLEDTVVFMSPPKGDGDNQAMLVSEDDDTQTALRLLGQSVGVIALGNKVVLIEGDKSSLDREVYSWLIRERHPELVLVPSGGKETIVNFARVVDSVLNKSIWGVEFFMLCDRDAMPSQGMGGVSLDGHPNFRMLSRYHLENYFLEEGVLATVFEEMEDEGSWLRSPTEIRVKLREFGAEIVPYAVALKVAGDFRFSVGNVDIMPSGADRMSLEELQEKMAANAYAENARVSEALDAEEIKEAVEKEFFRLQASLDDDGADWKSDLPGRKLLNKFASSAEIKIGKLKKMYMNKAVSHSTNPFQEVIELFDEFAK